MNSFSILKIFATALLVTVLAGPLIQRLLPVWSVLVTDVGPGGAWFVSIMYHIVYGIIIGAGGALAAAILGRLGRVLSLAGAAVAALATVLLFDAGFVILQPAEHPFAYLALLLALLAFVLHAAVAWLPIKRLKHTA